MHERKKKIIIMAPTPPPVMGPSMATTVILDSELVQKYDTTFIDTADRRDLDRLGAIDLTNLALAFRHYFALIVQIVRKRPDMVYFLVSPSIIGFFRDVGFIVICRMFLRRQTIHIRSGHFYDFFQECRPAVQWLIRFFLNRVDVIIVLCERVKREMEEIVPGRCIHVVENGRNFEFPAHTDRPRDGSRVLFLGNLIRTKGIFDVLNAVPQVAAKHPSVKFQIAGGWRTDEDRTEAEELIRRYAIRDNVEFFGIVGGTQKWDLLAAADLFVFPTYYRNEGHPWVIVEAMAAGLPVITTPIACIPETVLDGENGFLIPVQSPDRLAEKIIELLDDSASRLDMGRASRRIYEEKFSERSFIGKMEEAFELALSRNGRRTTCL